MYILGINATANDSAACLIRDGQILSAIEEKRLTRYKFQKFRPTLAIEKCLEMEGIGLADLDYISYSWKPWLYLRAETLWRLSRSLKHPVKSGYGLVQMIHIATSHLHDLWYYQQKAGSRPLDIEHHLCHTASSFFLSPFERAAIISIDNRGEDVTTLFAVGKGTDIQILKRIRIQHSLGKLYSGITFHLGFRAEYDEYKVMGLAPYGTPRYYNELKRMIEFRPNGGFALDTNLCDVDLDGRPTPKMFDLIGPPRQKGDPITQHHMDIATSLQKLHEEAVLHLVEHLYKLTGEENLCLTGGVSYNSVANGVIERESKFKNFYTPFCVGDSGAAIGGPLYIYHTLLKKPRTPSETHTTPYLGPGYTNEEIKQTLDACGLTYTHHKNIARKGAELIDSGKIIGWFQGRMEFGPRALGHRSIVADARRAEMKDKVNISVKRREEFRPFAPSVLEEHQGEMFESDLHSPYMTSVCQVKKGKGEIIPAVTHVDNTARIQTVNKKASPKYWELINEFRKITGVPVVLNTSFNVRDEPIVCSPAEAIACFYSCGIDALIMGDYCIEKGSAPVR